MSDTTSIQALIKQLEFDTLSAKKWAQKGKIELWVHRYLLTGCWANPAFSDGLKKAPRWWHGPFQVELSALSPAVGYDPTMEYVVEKEEWTARGRAMAETLSTPLSVPPLILEYRSGDLSIRDGNTRYGAMMLLGWPACWVILWYNTEHDYRQHTESLLQMKD